MGGAVKIMNLVSTSFHFLHLRRPVTVNLSCYTQLAVTSFHIHHHRRSLSFFPSRAGNSRFRKHTSSVAFRGSSSFADSASATASGSEAVRISWPQWGRLIDRFSEKLRKGGEGSGVDSGDDSFSGFEKLPSEFLASAEICLKFARQRPESLKLLTKKDVDLVVENGSPILFKLALNSLRRMRAFVNSANCSVSDNETEGAETVDLMRYLLGHVYNNLFSPRAYTRTTKVFEESVHNLFNELVNLTETTQPIKFTEMHNQSSTGFQQPNFANQFSTSFQQSPFLSGQNIEMKRGDWICSNCKFMNFAKNAECLECQMARPKRQLTGEEWECPQCDFFNYGQNMVCLKCNCKRPLSPFIGGISTIITEIRADIEQKLAETDEKSEIWFNEASQISDTNMSNLNNVINDKDLPEITPLRECSSRYVSDSRMLQEGTAHNQYKRNTSDDDGSRIVGKNSSMSKPLECLDSIIDEQKKPQERLINDQYTRNRGDNNAVKIKCKVSSISKTLDRILSQQSTLDKKEKSCSQHGNGNPSSKYESEVLESDGGFIEKSLEGSDVTDPDPLDISEEIKAQRWFRRVAQMKDISELSNIPDEDFPEIMPMRKGVNRIVVSKRKTQRLLWRGD
ncbi:hypothetical protein ZOSMA_82G00370 [Zostera marina]|uniref:RanBP2-type domain-containing protein n=1 Tax=Zostera marina TaxID=29655 RepID=A0A0K9NP29_ZOSMR|nr:hypothetical protein ZOSMA_82G00370 [Zostera marina]